MDIESQIAKIRTEIPEYVKLIAVSKTQPIENILQAYNKTGQKVFGENKAQELIQKHELLPKDIEWHMIGHLQTNKVRFIAQFVEMIHSIDSLKLLQIIDSESEKYNRRINCLLQVKIAREESKFGLSACELTNILDTDLSRLKNIRISGLMGMATYTDNEKIIRDEFRRCKQIFDEMKAVYFLNDPDFKEISMGMSDDYKLAIEEGATIVRIGSKIFGQRIYIS